ncbi:MAG: hypothetical protein LBU73_09670 [Helicobacteraceae bacterium]|jgi:polyphosphate kinase 2 (PPK2 family)|nr:hypothetical protein [Helicobacteraceae bacterium]
MPEKEALLELSRLRKAGAFAKKKVAIVCEGRSFSGKSALAKYLAKALGEPFYAANARGRGAWLLAKYTEQLPNEGEIAFFDRGWYAELDANYDRAAHQIPLFEKALIEDGFTLLKYFLEISKEELIKRLEKRKDDPLKKSLLNDTELKSPKEYENYSKKSAETLIATHTPGASWHIVAADEKFMARSAVAAHIAKAVGSKSKIACDLVRIYEPKLRF